MQNTSFNTYMAKYVYYANQLATARCEYIAAKERYRRFAKTENQLGKPGKKEHYEPPLTMCKKRDILKAEAQKNILSLKNKSVLYPYIHILNQIKSNKNKIKP